jgi:urea transport system substrate-binding protein
MTEEFPKSRTCPQSGSEEDRSLKPDRRTVVKGAAAASIALPTYLRDFNFMQSAKAQGTGPVKLGFIEDESGNLAVYGLQKLHAAQLAVKEINEGKTLKGAPNIGAGILGAMGQVASSLR